MTQELFLLILSVASGLISWRLFVFVRKNWNEDTGEVVMPLSIIAAAALAMFAMVNSIGLLADLYTSLPSAYSKPTEQGVKR